MEIEHIIKLMKHYSFIENNSELGEQEAAASSGGSSAPYPTVTKWETGIARSVANQIDDKVKWKDLYKITRGKANTLL
jgi:hypothetical protein